ncbi:chemotaxis protein CheC [Pelovirga terrestris]|uniref:Chemotaxis protein CheX n=1 Tax=Pelovirga terrestris TaxID=2771352 RepID=A0A8J6UQW9_9BACT|nr:chemotaxis protein CheX [Pelovirga terrestris]MBD1399901.1 chemotaxis protein CheX [Pelovirga terrestris]
MMIAGQTSELFTDSRLIETGIRSALVSFGQMLPQGSLVLKSQDFIRSSAARSCWQQLRCDGVQIALSLSGRISGTIILALDNQAAQQLVTALTGDGTIRSGFNEMARSALREAGNIVASAFLGALESLCGRGGLPGVPDLHLGGPCQIDSGRAEDMYALPLLLVAPAGGTDAARAGVFINLHNNDDGVSSFGDL